MKVKVTVTLDVDPDAWALNYCIDPKDIKKDVKTHFIGLCEDHLKHIGCESNSQKPSGVET